jgi:hypothetical protein
MAVIKSKKQRQSGKRKTLHRKSKKIQKGGTNGANTFQMPIGARPSMRSMLTPKQNNFYTGQLKPLQNWRHVKTIKRGNTSGSKYGPNSSYSKPPKTF